jgi:peptide/nickel transport system permease protein
MGRYILSRLVLYIPTLIGVSVLIFVIMRVVPGDPAAIILGSSDSGAGTSRAEVDRLRTQLGLDKPWPVQYLDWISAALRLDFGQSLRYGSPVATEIAKRIPVTAELALLALAFGVAAGLPLGIITAVRHNSWIDNVGRVAAVLGLAVPNFWAGTIIILALSLWFNWAPPLGYAELLADPVKHVQQMLPAVIVLGYGFAAYVARLSRAQMLEVVRGDYIRTAYAKGLEEPVVVRRHALKNALVPVVTLSGLQLGALLGGTVTIELIFSIPGLGRLLLDALSFRDYPTIQAVVLLVATGFLTINLLVDIVYSWIDPRIRYS